MGVRPERLALVTPFDLYGHLDSFGLNPAPTRFGIWQTFAAGAATIAPTGPGRPFSTSDLWRMIENGELEIGRSRSYDDSWAHGAPGLLP